MSAIIACLWQGLAIAWLTALLLRAAPSLNAATRHTIWWLALATVLALPFAHAAAPLADLPGPALALSVDANTPALILPAPPDWLIAAVAGAWLGVVLLACARLAASVQMVGAVKSRSQPVGELLQRSLPLWSAVRGTGRNPELRVSGRMSGACALGLRGRPVILVSARLLAALDPARLDQIVMHEHAHLVRYDDWLRMIQSLVAALCGLHPAVRFINARIDLEREAACDDRVVVQTGAAGQYASCLADAADLACEPHPLSLQPSVAPRAAPSRDALLVRVQRLLDPRASRDRGLKWASTGASLLAFSIAAIFSPAAQPLVIVLGAITGAPVQLPIGVQRIEWRASELVPPVPPTSDPFPPIRETERHRPQPSVTRPPNPVSIASREPLAFERQLSWTKPAAPAPRPVESNHPVLSATALQPWSRPGGDKPLTSRSSLPETNVDVDPALRAAGTAGAAVGVAIARASVAASSSSRKAGTAVAGFFSRAGKAVADSF